MKCVCCNRTLSDYEATRRHRLTNEYLDICGGCMKVIGESVSVPVYDRPELLLQGDVEEDSDHDTQDTQEDPVDELTGP